MSLQLYMVSEIKSETPREVVELPTYQEAQLNTQNTVVFLVILIFSHLNER